VIKFAVDQDGLILKCLSESWDNGWVWKELKDNAVVTISRVFTLERGDLVEEPSEDQNFEEFEYQFRFAKRAGAYYRIKGRVFSVPNDVLIAESGIKLERKLFVAERNISIFKRLAEVVGPDRDIVVGGSQSGSIPVDVFEQLLNNWTVLSSLCLMRRSPRRNCWIARRCWLRCSCGE
jgi:hypothetical protein